jgi:hypothetical protein
MLAFIQQEIARGHMGQDLESNPIKCSSGKLMWSICDHFETAKQNDYQ